LTNEGAAKHKRTGALLLVQQTQIPSVAGGGGGVKRRIVNGKQIIHKLPIISGLIQNLRSACDRSPGYLHLSKDFIRDQYLAGKPEKI
jgi:hypothetical protein